MKNSFPPIALWALTLISLPIVGWILGEGWLLRGVSAAVLMQACAVTLILYQAWGLARTLKTLSALMALAYLTELLGSSTGLPFGKYHYTNILQPQLAGVPLLIPLAWLMMLPPAWAIGQIISPRRGALLAALAFTAWDLFLDPQMVGWGVWAWEIPGQYFGIPLSNYLGWLLISMLMTLILRPRALPRLPLALIYALTWALQTIGQGIFWGQPGPALVGFLVSGLFVLLAWRKLPAGALTV